jgi:hypothetical protein
MVWTLDRTAGPSPEDTGLAWPRSGLKPSPITSIGMSPV